MGVQELRFKKGFTLQSAFFAVIVIGVVITAVGTSLSEWDNQYNTSIPYDLGDDFNKLDDISDDAGNQQDRLAPNDPDPGTDAESSTFRGGYGIIANIYEPFRVVFGDNGMIDAVTERFGLPDYVRQAIVTMMVMALTFSIVAIVFRLPRSSA